MCINRKAVIGLVAAGVIVYLVAPGAIGAALPLLLLAISPLSMFVMMRAMSGGKSKSDANDQSESSEVNELRAEVELLRVEQRSAQSFAPPTQHALNTDGTSTAEDRPGSAYRFIATRATGDDRSARCHRRCRWPHCGRDCDAR